MIWSITAILGWARPSPAQAPAEVSSGVSFQASYPSLEPFNENQLYAWAAINPAWPFHVVGLSISHPKIAVDRLDPNLVHVVWAEKQILPNGFPGDADICYKSVRFTPPGTKPPIAPPVQSSATGIQVNDPSAEPPTTHDGPDQFHPSIAVDVNNAIHVLWYDGARRAGGTVPPLPCPVHEPGPLLRRVAALRPDLQSLPPWKHLDPCGSEALHLPDACRPSPSSSLPAGQGVLPGPVPPPRQLDPVGNLIVSWPVPCSTPPGLYHFAYELVIAPEGPPGGINFVSNHVEVLVNP